MFIANQSGNDVTIIIIVIIIIVYLHIFKKNLYALL